MPLIQVLWYLDEYLVDCGNTDAVVVVDETPAMAAKIAMSDGRTRVPCLAVSLIKQKDLSNAVGGALQHGLIMRYMLEDDHMKQGAAAQREKGHPEHGDTHHAEAETKEKKTRQGAARTRGDGGTKTTRLKTGTTSDRHHKARTRHGTTPPPKKKTKGEGGGKPHPRQHPHTPTPQAAP